MKTIKDITPQAFWCALSAACPAVFEYGWDDLLIIGERVDVPPELASRVGEGEVLVKIKRGLVAGIESGGGDSI